MPTYRPPIPTNASKTAVSNFAEQVATEMSFDPGDSIETVVAQMNGSISFRNPVGETHPESIIVEPDRRFKIFLPSMTSTSRDRFTIAHELGHFFLHFPRVQEQHPGDGMRATRWVDENDKTQQRCEWEANWFAGSFTMPEAPFRAAYLAGGSLTVARAFGVSQKAADVRAKSLELA